LYIAPKDANSKGIFVGFIEDLPWRVRKIAKIEFLPWQRHTGADNKAKKESRNIK
jgi:hypothetical protein